MKSGIYCLRNTKNGKRYVGSAKDVRQRTSKHLRLLRAGKHDNRHLQAAWNLGQRFVVQVLELCEESVLVEREQFFIDRFNTCDKKRGYNLTIAGRTIPSEEGRKRISESRKGKTWEEIYGKDQAQELREEYRERFSGKGNPRHGSGGASHPFTGKTTEELFGKDVAEKMKRATSNSQRGRKLSENAKKKISSARKGKSLSESHRLAIGVGVNKNYKAVGPRTFEEKYGERAEEIRRKISESVSKSTKGSKKSKKWVEKMKARRDPVTGRILPKAKV